MLTQETIKQVIGAQRLNMINRGMGQRRKALSSMPDNIDREIGGLTEAMDFFDLKKGTIVTFSQTDIFTKGNKTIHVIPAHQYLMPQT